ncbi:hypothetical protein BV25DRAFT_1427333 [Artomyces pyxidatus]|uniref:Uncharacterized protein n=1 Tax=Artomyces pyxidatus TaxID=48021 RepID=A0ACB8SMH3_9AGAM|nr:hypothetical protein BV25DRAFT_1427333 [Artomyces pyxidatus]
MGIAFRDSRKLPAILLLFLVRHRAVVQNLTFFSNRFLRTSAHLVDKMSQCSPDATTQSWHCLVPTSLDCQLLSPRPEDPPQCSR